MTTITTCPSCTTQFFVTQFQLTANKGKVRCGQCKHVFNANENLSEVSTHKDALNEEISSSQAFDVAISENVSESSPIEQEHQHINLLPLEEEFTQQADPALSAELIAENYAVEPQNTELLADKVQIETFPPETQLIESTQLMDFIARPEPAATESSEIENYFTAPHKPDNSSTKKMSRWIFLAFIIILLPLALMQSIYYFRTPIASQLPQVKPYLVKACLLVGCKVELPKQLDSLAIDDSEMREDADHDHVLQFSITLLNKANITTRYPSIELTLTDANDDAVIRRTFTPDEYLNTNHKPTTSNIDAGFAAKDRLHITLALSTKDVLVAGYRLELVE